MFVVLLTYERPLAEIDRAMQAHVAFLEEGYRAGLFLACGRQVPRRGGVILVVEFRTSLHHPALSRFADPRTRAVRGLEAGP